MAKEDYTTYTEFDPRAIITVASDQITWSNFSRSDSGYVCIDKGANFYDGDFTLFLTIRQTLTATGGAVVLWALANEEDEIGDLIVAGTKRALYLVMSASTIDIAELDRGNTYPSSSYSITLGTSYYLKIVRDEAVGSHGTIYCYIYSDAGRLNLLDTLSVALHTSKVDYRYLYGFSSYFVGGTGHPMSGYCKDLATDVADVGSTFPAEAITRVNGLVHRYDRNKQQYTLEIVLGSVTTDFGLPQWLSTPQTAAPTRSLPIEGGFQCKTCGMWFLTVEAYALHAAETQHYPPVGGI